MTSITENEMDIGIPLRNCPTFQWNIEHFSGNLSKKDTLTEKKILNTSETILLLFFIM